MSETEVLENQGKLDELYIKEYLDQLKTAEQASYKADREYEADSKNTEKKEAFVEARKTEIQACLAAAEALVKITDGAIDIPTAKSLIKEQRAGVHEICEGLEHGLTKEQVRLYANPEFSNLQMREIRSGLENGLTEEQIRLYARPKFGYVNMREIRSGLEHGLSEEQVRLFANPEFNDGQMKEIRLGLEGGLSMEQVGIYAKPLFYGEQMKELRLGLQNMGFTAKESNQPQHHAKRSMMGKGR